MRSERVAREKRLDAWAVDVSVALAQRDAWVVECEQRAGQGLVAMTGTGGLSVRDAAQRCEPDLSPREASRLRRLCPEPVPDRTDGDVDGCRPRRFGSADRAGRRHRRAGRGGRHVRAAGLDPTQAAR